jgi:hypothetical protein
MQRSGVRISLLIRAQPLLRPRFGGAFFRAKTTFSAHPVNIPIIVSDTFCVCHPVTDAGAILLERGTGHAMRSSIFPCVTGRAVRSNAVETTWRPFEVVLESHGLARRVIFDRPPHVPRSGPDSPAGFPGTVAGEVIHRQNYPQAES